MATKKNISLVPKNKMWKLSRRLRDRVMRCAKAELFHYGKTQISGILKNREALMQLYESNAKDDLCQARK